VDNYDCYYSLLRQEKPAKQSAECSPGVICTREYVVCFLTNQEGGLELYPWEISHKRIWIMSYMYTSIFLVLSHVFGYVEEKLLGRQQKSLVFLLHFYVCEFLSFVTFSCTFAAIQILDNIGCIPFISWVISMKLSGYYFFMHIYSQVSLKNIQK
jgi:hypothetical protein